MVLIVEETMREALEEGGTAGVVLAMGVVRVLVLVVGVVREVVGWRA